MDGRFDFRMIKSRCFESDDPDPSADFSQGGLPSELLFTVSSGRI